MKKLFLATALAALSCGSVFAATTSADQIRIYINPGHGSWGPNNRPCNLIGHRPYTTADPDTTSFYESNTNLWKAFSLLDHLVDAGVPFDRTKNQTNDNPARVGAALDMTNNIVMSHVAPGPYPYTGKPDDENNAHNRPLSEIREEVEVNNFDLFISIHSNAASEGSSTNYPLFLYRGSDAEACVPGSKEIAQRIWPYIFSNAHQTWSYYSMTNANVRGDWNFYGSHDVTMNNGTGYDGYLGVLKHGVMGFLAEGYFHTYQPARHRAINVDVSRHEGQLYARGVIDYMGWKAETTGDIYGIVRDLHEKFADPLYSPAARTNDQYKPLNGVVVTLYKDGAEVAKYTTDNNYNGAFIFKDLEPGKYTLTYAAEGYKPAFEEYLGEVTVEANKTAYINTFLEVEGYEPPAIVYENYNDALEGYKAYNVGSEYNFIQSTLRHKPLEEQLAGKTVRRQIIRNGKLYVLALDEANEPYIYAYTMSDGNVAQISTDGIELKENRKLKISDIAFTADNYLVATSFGENQFGAEQVKPGDVRGSVAAYKWEKDDTETPTGAPVEWFTSQNSGNYYNALTGKTVAFSGTTAEGALMTTAQTTGSSTSLRWVEFSISDNAMVATTFINKDVSAESNWTATKLGDDYQLIVSPLADNQYIVDGSNANPTEWQTAAQNTDAPLLGTVTAMDAEANGATCFKYAGHSLLVAPAMTEGKSTGIRLFDITDGLNNAREIKLNIDAVDAIEAKCVTAIGEVITELDSEEKVKNAYIQLTLIRDGEINAFTTAGKEQPIVRGEYAYNLNAEVTSSQTTFTFTSTGEAEGGLINVYEQDGTMTSFPTGAITEGENEVLLKNEDMPQGILSWEVQLNAKPIATPTKFFADAFSNARGVVFDNNVASSNYGTVYVSNTVAGAKAKGLWKYDQKLTAATAAIGTEEFSKGNTASPFRLGMLNDGTVIASDWSDAHAGLWMVNPADNTITNMFEGTKEASGAIVNNGAVIGGGTTGVSVIGEGENTVLYTFCEDYPTGNEGNKLLRYNIGTSTTIAAAPDKVFDAPSGKLINTNVEVRATENGIWAAQTRAAGNNNADVPSLVYTDNEGTIVYNSGASNNADLNGSNGSGFAINTTNDKLAIANGDSNVVIFDLTWAENVPTLTYLYTITVGKGAINEMVFDTANNLYIAAHDEFSVWSLPNVTSAATTKAFGTIEIKSGGIEENVAAKVASVYPNPADEVLNIEAATAIESVHVYTLSGAAVNAQANVDGNKATLNVSGLTAGIYVVRVNDTAIRFIKK